jgi:hypothetical protein
MVLLVSSVWAIGRVRSTQAIPYPNMRWWFLFSSHIIIIMEEDLSDIPKQTMTSTMWSQSTSFQSMTQLDFASHVAHKTHHLNGQNQNEHQNGKKVKEEKRLEFILHVVFFFLC